MLSLWPKGHGQQLALRVGLMVQRAGGTITSWENPLRAGAELQPFGSPSPVGARLNHLDHLGMVGLEDLHSIRLELVLAGPLYFRDTNGVQMLFPIFSYRLV